MKGDNNSHIDEMATDVERQLVSKLQVNEFALQIDESTLPDNSALMMAFVRPPHADGVCQEMLFVLEQTADTSGGSVFKKVKVYFEEKNNHFRNLVT